MRGCTEVFVETLKGLVSDGSGSGGVGEDADGTDNIRSWERIEPEL